MKKTLRHLSMFTLLNVLIGFTGLMSYLMYISVTSEELKLGINLKLTLAGCVAIGLYAIKATISSWKSGNSRIRERFLPYYDAAPSKSIETEYVSTLKLMIYITIVSVIAVIIYAVINSNAKTYYFSIPYPALFSFRVLFQEIAGPNALTVKLILGSFSLLVFWCYAMIAKSALSFIYSYDIEDKKFTYQSFRSIKSLGLWTITVAAILSLVIIPFEITYFMAPSIFNLPEDINGFSYGLFADENKAIVDWKLALGLIGECIVIFSEFMRRGIELETDIEGVI